MYLTEEKKNKKNANRLTRAEYFLDLGLFLTQTRISKKSGVMISFSL